MWRSTCLAFHATVAFCHRFQPKAKVPNAKPLGSGSTFHPPRTRHGAQWRNWSCSDSECKYDKTKPSKLHLFFLERNSNTVKPMQRSSKIMCFFCSPLLRNEKISCKPCCIFKKLEVFPHWGHPGGCSIGALAAGSTNKLRRKHALKLLTV